MKILITGVCGKIGSRLSENLAALGHHVDGADYNLKASESLKHIQNFLLWDVRMKYYGRPRYDTVIHLAALTNVEESIEDPRSYYRTNLIGTMKVADTVITSNFIYVTCARDEAPSPYERSKRAAEDIVQQLPVFQIIDYVDPELQVLMNAI